MKMKLNPLCAFVLIVLTASSCTKLNSGDSFNQTYDGIEYNFEVIVSKMGYVRLSPVSSPSVVTGDIVLPTFGQYDGDTYTVTQIAEEAFEDYTGITSIVLPETISQIEEEAFAGCFNLRSINTPQTLSVIGEYAFDGCVQLEKFSLEASISELGEGAFRNCARLEKLEFTPTFTKIPDELCMGCLSLKEVVLPSTIMNVGWSAFEGCRSIRSVTMDRSVQSIGSRAFYGCTAIQSIECLTATPPACPSDVFVGVNPEIPVTVPMANVNSYLNASGWSYFVNYIGVY